MKKICIAFNHFQFSDGVARSAVAIANHLAKIPNIEVTLRPIYKIEKDMLELVDNRVKVNPVFGFYFNGMSKLFCKLPDSLIYKIVFNDKFDIEIGFQYGTATVAAGSSTNKNAQHLIWMHTYDSGLVYSKYYQKADKVICVAKHNAERLSKELLGKVNADYCYNPIDETDVISKGNEQSEFTWGDGIRIISVGRHSEEKGYMRLIDISSRLFKEGYKFSLVLVGDGPQHTELVKKVNDYNLSRNVLFTGNQPNPHKYTGKADLFVCSSYSEGYSTACTEALMLGVPVLTTSVSGGQEIIDEAECGMLIGMEDEELYSGLKFVLDNPEVLNEWKDKLNTTKKHFYSEARVKRLLGILNIL